MDPKHEHEHSDSDEDEDEFDVDDIAAALEQPDTTGVDLTAG